MLLSVLLAANIAVLAKVAAAFAAALVVLAASYGMGKIGSSAMEAMARQPESIAEIRTSMVIIAALLEGAALFAIIVCLMVALG